jgi:hypothetical protein
VKKSVVLVAELTIQTFIHQQDGYALDAGKRGRKDSFHLKHSLGTPLPFQIFVLKNASEILRF